MGRKYSEHLTCTHFHGEHVSLLTLARLQTPLKRVTSVSLCCANKQLILSRVAFYCDQSKAHLCSNHAGNQHVNMPHLSAGWIILAKQKHSLTWNLKRFCSDKNIFLCEKVWDLLLQLKENGWGLFLKPKIINANFPQRSPDPWLREGKTPSNYLTGK